MIVRNRVTYTVYIYKYRYMRIAMPVEITMLHFYASLIEFIIFGILISVTDIYNNILFINR